MGVKDQVNLSGSNYYPSFYFERTVCYFYQCFLVCWDKALLRG